MALISNSSVIVEAGETSGALSQEWETLKLRRPLFISEPLFSMNLTWPAKMVRYGARILTDVDELLEILKSDGRIIFLGKPTEIEYGSYLSYTPRKGFGQETREAHEMMVRIKNHRMYKSNVSTIEYFVKQMSEKLERMPFRFFLAQMPCWFLFHPATF